jgi:hypothetical protein
MHTRDDVFKLLTLLHNHYGDTHVRSEAMVEHLPLLRCLEAEGFVRVIRVALVLQWVSTPMGAIWREVEGRRLFATDRLPVNMDKDLMIDPQFAWMKASEAQDAMFSLSRLSFISGAPDMMPTEAVPGVGFAYRFT